ncbi:MAG: hypothetical protein ABI763_12335 [Bacteroidota bacterium]
MKSKIILIGILLFTSTFLQAQIRIDGTFPFQTDTAKQYSLFIPSGYNASIPHRVMLALHPLNISVWNSISWCDTLRDFAESNNLILVCPDGGVDGMIDDPIDTAFTSALLDSVQAWYNIDLQKIYVMGFSWGGKTTYTYGLSHAWRFGGFIPIGAAVNGTTEVTGIIQNAAGKPFYLVHGESDSPGTRFYPVRTALINNGAIEKDTLMPGIAHTINFPNRNQILSAAYQWIDSVNCANLSIGINPYSKTPVVFSIFPSVIKDGVYFTLEINISEQASYQFKIFDASSKLMETKSFSFQKGLNQVKYIPAGFKTGTYFVVLKNEKGLTGIEKIIIE